MSERHLSSAQRTLRSGPPKEHVYSSACDASVCARNWKSCNVSFRGNARPAPSLLLLYRYLAPCHRNIFDCHRNLAANKTSCLYHVTSRGCRSCGSAICDSRGLGGSSHMIFLFLRLHTCISQRHRSKAFRLTLFALTTIYP